MLNCIKHQFAVFVADSRFSQIFTSSIWALSARILATLMGLMFTIVVARCYGVRLVGIVAVINSFLMLGSIFTVLGTPTSILRLVSEHLLAHSPASALAVYRKVLALVIIVSMITGLFFFFGADFVATICFSKPHLSYYLSLAACFLIFKSMERLNTQAVRSVQLIKAFSLLLLLPRAMNLAGLLVVGWFWSVEDLPVYVVLAGSAITGLLGWGIMEGVFRKKVQPDDSVTLVSLKSILSISLPMLFSGTMILLISQAGVLILGMFHSETEVGYYAVALKLAMLTTFILQAVNSMAAPKFSELFYRNNFEDLFYIAKKSAKLVFFTTIPILLMLICFGKFILGTMFGVGFTAAYPALVFLVLGQFVNAVSGSSGVFLNMTGHQKVFSHIMVIAAVMNIGLSMVFIPFLGLNGAAISAMISIWYWNIATLIYIKIKFGKSTGYFPWIAY